MLVAEFDKFFEKIPLMKQIIMASSTLSTTSTTITTPEMTYAAIWPVVRTPITMGQLASVVEAFAGVMVCATVVLAATTGFSVWKKNACTVTVLEWKEEWGWGVRNLTFNPIFRTKDRHCKKKCLCMVRLISPIFYSQYSCCTLIQPSPQKKNEAVSSRFDVSEPTTKIAYIVTITECTELLCGRGV